MCIEEYRRVQKSIYAYSLIVDGKLKYGEARFHNCISFNYIVEAIKYNIIKAHEVHSVLKPISRVTLYTYCNLITNKIN